MNDPFRRPRVTIGLAVYNGENFLEQAIASHLAQDYTDFELLIADNASVDRTREICEAFARRDARISYFLSDRNRGASWNFNRLVGIARGDYFVWSAHDDVYRPGFLSQCVAALDQHEESVLCCVGAVHIDADGHPLGPVHLTQPVESSDIKRHFRDVMQRPQVHQIFGLIRLPALRSTGLIGPFAGGDEVLLGELALHGSFVEVPEPLFLNREHQGSSMKVHRTLDARNAWFDSTRTSAPSLARTRMAREYLGAIRRAPLSSPGRAQARREVLRWCWRQRRSITGELARMCRYRALRLVRPRSDEPLVSNPTS